MGLLDKLNIDEKTLEKLRVQYTPEQAQTESTFGYKWKMREFYENEEIKVKQREWLVDRYCGGDEAMFSKWLAGGGKIIMDAGCGSGYSGMLFWGDYLKDNLYLGVDISDAIEVAKERFKEASLPGEFLKVSVLDLPVPENSIDIIFSEGVLHHTDSTERSIKYLTGKLKKDGLFMFYVYVKKAPIREFTDDHIRQQISGMNNDEAWNALMPLTKLGKALADLNTEIDVPEDIPYLGIKKGRIDIQRFFYWYICKMWVRPEVNLNEMNIVNFDWFRPLNCQRHTPEEVKEYCSKAGLEIEHMDVQESGITVVAKKL
ncbi:MAG: class I SAM-dependent methyltransferase [Ignavibacteria bacterium]|nr:class I SAM-dependent methyltransferase [Ignavibacteria bacterium]